MNLVLGVFRYKPNTPVNDLYNGFNDYYGQGQNLPDTGAGIVLSVMNANATSSNVAMQIFMSSDSQVYFRLKWNSWGSWIRV